RVRISARPTRTTTSGSPTRGCTAGCGSTGPAAGWMPFSTRRRRVTTTASTGLCRPCSWSHWSRSGGTPPTRPSSLSCSPPSRSAEVPAFPMFAWALWTGAFGTPPTREQRIARLRSFGAVLASAAVAFVGYDELMWGTILDVGHTVYYHADAWGSPTGSPFQL